MVYGFNKKKTAENLASIGRQRPAGYNGLNAVPTPAQHFICLTPEDGIPAITEDESGHITLGQADCEIYSIDSVDDLVEILVNKNAGAGPLNFENLNAPVWNISRTLVPGEQYRVVHQVGDKWVVEQAEPSVTKIIRFRTTAKAVQRQVAAEVEFSLGGDAQVGDSIVVNDSRNLYPDIESGATGTAFWYTDEDADPDPIERWEVLNCSAPANDIVVMVRQDMTKDNRNATQTGWYGSANVNSLGQAAPISDWNRSDAPNNDTPPEQVEASTNQYAISFNNPLGLDCPRDSQVRIRRVTNRKDSDPGNDVVPKTGTATAAVWEAVAVQEIIARWICVESSITSPGDTFPSKYIYRGVHWEGDPIWKHSPLPVDVTAYIQFTCLNPPCVKPGSYFLCVYNPELNKYHPVASVSGVLGDPIQVDLTTKGPQRPTGTDDPCENNEYCWEWPTEKYLGWTCQPENEEIPEEDQVTWDQCIDQSVFDCLDLCEYVCANCEQYADDPACGPCKDSCVYIWDEAANDWILDADDCTNTPGCVCPGKPQRDGNFDGEQVRQRCDAVQEPSCNNCQHCVDQQLSLQELIWGKVAAKSDGSNPGVPINTRMDLDYQMVAGTERWVEDCTFEVEIEWNATHSTLGALASVKDVATVTYDGNKWSVTVADGSPYTADQGNFDILEPKAACGGIFTCEKPNGEISCAIHDPVDAMQQINARLETVAEPCQDPPVLLAPMTMMLGAASVPDLSLFGEYFYHSNRDLFSGCGCKKDAVAVMNRVTVDEFNETTKSRLISMLHSKNTNYSMIEITMRIDNAYASWVSGQNA